MVSPTAIKALARELVSLDRSPTHGIRVSLCDSDMLSFSGWIQGPPGTPYAGGFFRITFDFANIDFPNVPPTCRFATSIFHPNVSKSGEICVSSLKKDWKPQYGIERILVTIKCLLIEPNPDSALDAEASRLMQEDWDSYAETARLWTSVHASRKPACFDNGDVAASATHAKATVISGAKPVTSIPQAQQSLAPCSAAASLSLSQTANTTVRPKVAVSTAPKRGLRRL